MVWAKKSFVQTSPLNDYRNVFHILTLLCPYNRPEYSGMSCIYGAKLFTRKHKEWQYNCCYVRNMALFILLWPWQTKRQWVKENEKVKNIWAVKLNKMAVLQTGNAWKSLLFTISYQGTRKPSWAKCFFEVRWRNCTGKKKEESYMLIVIDDIECMYVCMRAHTCMT